MRNVLAHKKSPFARYYFAIIKLFAYRKNLKHFLYNIGQKRFNQKGKRSVTPDPNYR